MPKGLELIQLTEGTGQGIFFKADVYLSFIKDENFLAS